MLIRILGFCIVTAAIVLAALAINGSNDAPEPVWDSRDMQWTRARSSVYWDRSEWGEGFSSSIDEAIGMFPCRMFNASSRVDADVLIVSANGAPCGIQGGFVDDPSHAEQAYLCPDGTAEIHVYAPGNIAQMYLIVAHGLGHVAGLAHDGRVEPGSSRSFVSIMADNVASQSGRLDRGLLLPRLSDKDDRALRDRFCR